MLKNLFVCGLALAGLLWVAGDASACHKNKGCAPAPTCHTPAPMPCHTPAPAPVCHQPAPMPCHTPVCHQPVSTGCGGRKGGGLFGGGMFGGGCGKRGGCH